MKQKRFYGTGNLYLTPLNRIVLDNHGHESFAEPYDIVLATYEELTTGIKAEKIFERLLEARK